MSKKTKEAPPESLQATPSERPKWADGVEATSGLMNSLYTVIVPWLRNVFGDKMVTGKRLANQFKVNVDQALRRGDIKLARAWKYDDGDLNIVQ